MHPAKSRKTSLFQFTPLREGRRGRRRNARMAGRYFNSRPSARGDNVRTWSNWDGTSISIHAPPRGATADAVRGRESRHYFNSRPSARGDVLQATTSETEQTFQFTPLREGRRDCGEAGYVRWHFNSRPSARGDVTAKVYDDYVANFNSRPSARGDELFKRCSFAIEYFNSRPSARGDEKNVKAQKKQLISIHAPPRGATEAQDAQEEGRKISIHAPPRGATWRCCSNSAALYFNSRPSARGDCLWVNKD